ncbi:MAG: TrkA family potassium uptake protein [Magnetococcales bacterium]|nr:TrkA family potassium uptake protein [Magnetococcales bacterium]MBF0582912.1 TrkA family potassium uptake protein [Magnetococcales bacterium]
MAETNSFLVVGLGTFGAQVATTLFDGGAEVLAVDINELAVNALRDHVTRAVCCDATDEKAMQALGAYDMSAAIVALHNRFDVTVLVTHSLKKQGVTRILAHVGTVKEEEAIFAVGATEVIFPPRDMALRIAHKLIHPDLVDQIPLGKGVSLIEMRCPHSFVGQSLRELDLRNTYGISVVALKRVTTSSSREAEVIQVNPSPTVPLQIDHALILLGSPTQLTQFKEKTRQ